MDCQGGILALILVSLFITPSLQGDESRVPVLIWNFKNPADLKYSHNSLQYVDTDSFTTHLQKIIQKSSNPLVLAFIEPMLSVEDLSLKPTAFENVKEMMSQSKFMDYITSVNDASQGISNLGEASLSVREISDTLSILDNIDDVDVLIVKMSEADDRRFNTLQKHDKLISEVYRQVYEQRKNVIGVLTGDISMSSISSLFRYRRAAEKGSNAEDYNKVFFAENKYGKAMIYARAPPELILPTGTKYTLAKDKDTETQLDARTDYQRLIITQRTADNAKIKLRFRFDKLPSNSWTLKTVEVEALKMDISPVNLTASIEIKGTIGSGFIITKEVEFNTRESNAIRLVFPEGLKAQPFLPDDLGTNLRLGEPAKNPQYFTPGILMGIFVMAILMLVFTVALLMIMDIKTMDRFDDAKGKTITINTTE